mmetsp:Transcript_96255/g.170205  ORF Transcript_96255/g.170205 Transcript_96255/m.170205 type:complete len:275 (-) Transcript_96255:23-847(-)
MPLYEEKLISPFAIHYSQDHIRPVFQTGGNIENTIKEIKAKPGTGDYDVVLAAPFPNIEILRRHHRDGGKTFYHWMSLDNRRLYCLQRAAAAFWPQRVAVVVEALYAATDGIRKKENSSTGGLSVGIGHSPKTLMYRWDWREAAQWYASGKEAEAAHKLIALDENKGCIEDLLDAPAPPSMLELSLQSSPESGKVAEELTVELKVAGNASGIPGSVKKLWNTSPVAPHSLEGDGWYYGGHCQQNRATRPRKCRHNTASRKKGRSWKARVETPTA